MPVDITACPGLDCPLKDQCLRFTGSFYGRFDSFTSPPFDKKTNQCDSFYSDRPSENAIRDLAYKLWLENGSPFGKDAEFWKKAEEDLIRQKRQ